MATEPKKCRNCPAQAEHAVTVKHHRPNPDDMCREGEFYFCSPHYFELVLDGAFVIQHNNGKPCPRCGGKAEGIRDLFTAVSLPL
jgi:hypothetical protein